MSHTYQDDPEIEGICAAIVAPTFDLENVAHLIAEYVDGPQTGFYLLNVLMHNMAELFKGSELDVEPGHRIDVVARPYSAEDGQDKELDPITGMVFHCVEHAVNEEWHEFFEHVTMIVTSQEMFGEVISSTIPVYRALITPDEHAASRLVRAKMLDDGEIEILADEGPASDASVPEALRDSVFTKPDVTESVRQAHEERKAEYEEAARRAKERRGDDR